jgi:dolichol kinase
MNTKTTWAFLRTTAMLIGVVLFIAGLLRDEIAVFWLGTILFMAGFAALAQVTRTENLTRESSPTQE